MANKQINARIITKHDKEENWLKAVNFIPKLGEIIAYETDTVNLTPRLKIGNGIDVISSLPFITDPFVVKEEGKGLSSNDFTDIFQQKVAAIPDDPKYTDTTYSAGKEIGLNGTTFYNKGVIRISEALEPSSFNVITRTGPKEDDYIVQLVSLTGIDDKTKQDLLNSMTQQLSTSITTGTVDGSILVNGTNVPIKGWNELGELAFMNASDIGGLGEGSVEEILIAPTETTDLIATIKLWYNTSVQMLYVKESGNAYEPAFPNMITRISESENDGYITVSSFVDTYEVQVGSSGAYLPLTGGTLTGELISTSSDAFRLVQDNYGLILRNDNNRFWMLPTAAGDPYGAEAISTVSIDLATGALYGACWNDYAEFRKSNTLEPGRVVIEDGKDSLVLSTERLTPGGSIISDTFGFSIGETSQAKTPIAVCGRVLAYPCECREYYHPGDAVCTGPRGTVSKMTREEIVQFPDRIIGYVSCVPDYEKWGEANVAVNGRIWIKVI